MGVICWDGNVLATDSQSACQHMRRVGETRRLYAAGDWDLWKLEGKKVLAFAFMNQLGNAAPWIAQALTEDLTYKTTLATASLAFEAIIITEDAAFVWKYAKEGRGGELLNDLHPIIGATALGSGAPMAVAVMSVGKGARKAVETAIKFDLQSGGLIQTWTRTPETDVPKPMLRDAIFDQLEVLLKEDPKGPKEAGILVRKLKTLVDAYGKQPE